MKGGPTELEKLAAVVAELASVVDRATDRIAELADRVARLEAEPPQGVSA